MKKKIIHSTVILFLIQLFSSCVHDVNFNQGHNSINRIYNITDSSATIEGSFLWDDHPNEKVIVIGFTITKSKESDNWSDTVTVLGDKKYGTITCNLKNLKPNTVYYVIPYEKFIDASYWDIAQTQSFITLFN